MVEPKKRGGEGKRAFDDVNQISHGGALEQHMLKVVSSPALVEVVGIGK